MFEAAAPSVVDEYVVRIETMPAGNREDILVQDRGSLTQVTARASKLLAPNAVSALISDLREYARHKQLSDDVVIKRHRRRNAVMSAAIAKFRDESDAETWLHTPNAAFGFQCGLALAASTDQGLSFVLSVLADNTASYLKQPTEQAEQCLLTEALTRRSDANPDGIRVLNTLVLVSPSLPGECAWLIATQAEESGVKVVVPGTTTPQHAEALLLAKREEFQTCVERLDAFIRTAQEAGAFLGTPIGAFNRASQGSDQGSTDRSSEGRGRA